MGLDRAAPAPITRTKSSDMQCREVQDSSGWGGRMQHELSYRLPFARLVKLSRTASRKGYPLVWWLTWLWIGLFLAVMIGIAVFGNNIKEAFDPLDLGPSVLLVVVAPAFLAGMY